MAPVPVRGETPIRPYFTPRDRHGSPNNILKGKPTTAPDRCGGCGLCAALQFLSCLFGGRGCPVILCC